MKNAPGNPDNNNVMNFNSLFGFSAAFAIIWFGVISPSAKPQIFLDHHALILVFGGTIAAALIAYPVSQFRSLFQFVLMGVLFPPKKKIVKTVEQLLTLSRRPPMTSFNQPHKEFHPFLLEGYSLALRSDLSPAELKLILQTRMQKFRERYMWDAKALAGLAKFPPAFGLLGATTGMIAMMSNLGADAQKTIGPAMAIALVATFWGIAFANLILLPLSDHALKANADDHHLREMIAGALLLIHQSATVAVLYEYLIGFVPMKERLDQSVMQSILEARNRVPLKNGIQIVGGGNPPTGTEP